MERLREHRISLHRLIRTEKMGENLRFLAILFAMWLDAEGNERELVENAIRSMWADLRRADIARAKWQRTGDPSEGDQIEDEDPELKLANLFASVRKPGGADATVQSKA